MIAETRQVAIPLCTRPSRKLGLADEPLFQAILERKLLTALRVREHTSMEANRMGIELIERIRERAYQLWKAEGCEHGRDREHWFRAKAEMTGEQTAVQAQIQPSQTTPVLTPGIVSSSTTVTKPKERGRSAAEGNMETESVATATSAPRKVRSRKA